MDKTTTVRISRDTRKKMGHNCPKDLSFDVYISKLIDEVKTEMKGEEQHG